MSSGGHSPNRTYPLPCRATDQLFRTQRIVGIRYLEPAEHNGPFANPEIGLGQVDPGSDQHGAETLYAQLDHPVDHQHPSDPDQRKNQDEWDDGFQSQQPIHTAHGRKIRYTLNTLDAVTARYTFVF